MRGAKMKTLPNGAEQLAIYYDSDIGVVLADNGRDFVTWKFYRGDLASTSHGHYFPKAHYRNALDLAQQDFKDRVNDL
jgi:hypothetical protein